MNTFHNLNNPNATGEEMIRDSRKKECFQFKSRKLNMIPRSHIRAIQNDMLRVERLRELNMKGLINTLDVPINVDNELLLDFEAQFK